MSRGALLLGGLTTLVLAACDAPESPTAPSQPQFTRIHRAEICHYRPGLDTWRRIRVAQPAARAHLRRHDDALPGGTTSLTATRLDDSCKRIPPLALVVQTNRDGNWEIYAFRADGSERVNLTNHPASDVDPAWSPDGRHIVFRSDRDGQHSIYVMKADGTDVRRLTSESGALDDRPDWSPDGSRIVFRRLIDGESAIWTMDPDGSALRQLTFPGAWPERDGQPSWSPDGSLISYICVRSARPDICVVSPLDLTVQQITTTGTEGNIRSWTPDGSALVFSSGRIAPASSGGFELFRMNGDGSNVVRLTENAVNDADPAVSPTGIRLAFVRASEGPGAWQLFVAEGDASNAVNVSNEPAFSFNQPDWHPSSR